MLEHLHVKNLALIDEIEVDFSEGLNILSGETGAGKSIIIGSINIATILKFSTKWLITDSNFSLLSSFARTHGAVSSIYLFVLYNLEHCLQSIYLSFLLFYLKDCLNHYINRSCICLQNLLV